MIRKVFTALLLLASVAVSAQNVQLHYVPRHLVAPDDMPDNFLLSTVEMFKPDKWGSTFAFIDMTYDGSKGAINSAYWEIARDLKCWDFPLAAHVEYNGGVVDGVPNAIPNAYLLGTSYNFQLGGAFMGTYLVYKYNAFTKHSDDIQWTVTWTWNLFNDKLSLTGFMDWWTENKDRTGNGSESGKRLILNTQPQFWYNFTSHLAAGSEVEITSNFYYPNTKFYVFPTIAAKWTF